MLSTADAPLLRRDDAGDDVERGGFAGAVRTDHREELAARHREVDAAQRGGFERRAAVESDDDIVELNHRDPMRLTSRSIPDRDDLPISVNATSAAVSNCTSDALKPRKSASSAKATAKR